MCRVSALRVKSSRSLNAGQESKLLNLTSRDKAKTVRFWGTDCAATQVSNSEHHSQCSCSRYNCFSSFPHVISFEKFSTTSPEGLCVEPGSFPWSCLSGEHFCFALLSWNSLSSAWRTFPFGIEFPSFPFLPSACRKVYSSTATQRVGGVKANRLHQGTLTPP